MERDSRGNFKAAKKPAPKSEPVKFDRGACRLCGEGNFSHGPKIHGCCGKCVKDALEVYEGAINAPVEMLPFGLSIRVAPLQARRKAMSQ